MRLGEGLKEIVREKEREEIRGNERERERQIDSDWLTDCLTLQQIYQSKLEPRGLISWSKGRLERSARNINNILVMLPHRPSTFSVPAVWGVLDMNSWVKTFNLPPPPPPFFFLLLFSSLFDPSPPANLRFITLCVYVFVGKRGYGVAIGVCSQSRGVILTDPIYSCSVPSFWTLYTSLLSLICVHCHYQCLLISQILKL